MKRRMLSFLLVCCIIICILPTHVFATNESVKIVSVVEDAGTVAALSDNGVLYCWGRNEHGQVGAGNYVDQLVPVKVLENVISYDLCFDKAIALTKDSELFIWGDNGDGITGNDPNIPTKVLDNISEFVIYHDGGAAITNAGDLYCWGQISGSGSNFSELPVKILSNVIQFYIGARSNSTDRAALTADGSLYCWGYNFYGQVGNGTAEKQLKPVEVLKNVDKFYIGQNPYAITFQHELYSWGRNNYGLVGNGSLIDQLTPYKVLDDIAELIPYNNDQFGNLQMAAVSTDGDLYYWGVNVAGQAGNGTTSDYQLEPKKVDLNNIAYCYNDTTMVAITHNKDLYCWGENTGGLIGNGSMSDISVLLPEKILNSVELVATIHGNEYIGAITTDGGLYCWGNYDYYSPCKILDSVSLHATSSEIFKNSFVITDNLDLYSWSTSGVNKVLSDVHYFDGSNTAITSDGDLYCWGNNTNGQVGNGTTEYQSSPVKVLDNVEAIYSNSLGRMALTEDGSLYCWGSGSRGQVGNGTTEDQLIPYQVLFPTSSDISDDNNTTYTHFGKLDSYDANGSAVIDGVEYQFTEEFKDSSDNLAYLYGGNYLDNYVYAMYNLDTENRITALRWTTGILCTLEGWDATNSIVDTSLTPILPVDGAELKAGDYRVSEITKASFPTDQIADWVGDDIRVYTNGQEIFKVIHVEHKTGVVTAFDPSTAPLKVYIDDVEYSVVENDEGLVNTIRYPFDNYSEYTKDAEFTLYDGLLVALTYNNAKLDPANFNEYIYRADKLLDTSNAESSYLSDLMQDVMPANILVDALNDEGFAGEAAAWEIITGFFDSADDITNLADMHIEQKDMYSAIILEALQSVSYISAADKTKSYSKHVTGAVSTIKTVLKAEYGYDVLGDGNVHDVIKNMSAERIKKLSDSVDKGFKEYLVDEMGVEFSKISDVFTAFSDGIKCADYLDTYVEQVIANITLFNLSSSMKTVINQMYKSCPDSNIYMKAALKDCVNIINTSVDTFVQECIIKPGVIGAGVMIVDFGMEKLWDIAKDIATTYRPELAVLMASYKVGKFITNALFNTDATVEQYYKMLALLNFEDLSESVVCTGQDDFSTRRDEGTAQVFLDSVDLRYKFAELDCKYAIKFCEIVDSALYNKIMDMFGREDFASTIESIETIQNVYASNHWSTLINWIYWLQDDYPDSGLYEWYEHFISESFETFFNMKYEFDCPVNVYVYDANDRLVAYAADGIPYATEGIIVWIENESKDFYFVNDDNYRFVIEGYDTGDMDVSITEYEGNGEVLRTARFNNVPVTDGIHYSTYAKENPIDGESYVLSDGIKAIIADYDSMRIPTDRYSVFVENGYITHTDSEVFELSASFAPGEMIEVTAYVPTGCTFAGWTSNCDGLYFEDATAMTTRAIVPSSDVIITAKVVFAEHTITLSPTGGVVSPATVQTNTKGRISSLPVPTRTGYTFDGWYTAPVGGELVTTDTVFTANTTVYAHWTKNADIPTIPANPTKPGDGSNTPDTDVQNPFTDVPDDAYFSDAVAWAVENGITEGTSKTTFSPNAACTRAQAVTFLWRAAGSPTPKSTSMPFEDVKNGAYYYNAVLWAVENGVTKGTGKTIFSPDDTCTRAQIVTFLYRALGIPKAGGANPFVDVADNAYYTDAVLWAVEKGVTKGTSKTAFSPDDDCTRAQIVTFLYRSYQSD